MKKLFVILIIALFLVSVVGATLPNIVKEKECKDNPVKKYVFTMHYGVRDFLESSQTLKLLDYNVKSIRPKAHQNLGYLKKEFANFVANTDCNDEFVLVVDLPRSETGNFEFWGADLKTDDLKELLSLIDSCHVTIITTLDNPSILELAGEGTQVIGSVEGYGDKFRKAIEDKLKQKTWFHKKDKKDTKYVEDIVATTSQSIGEAIVNKKDATLCECKECCGKIPVRKVECKKDSECEPGYKCKKCKCVAEEFAALIDAPGHADFIKDTKGSKQAAPEFPAYAIPLIAAIAILGFLLVRRRR